MADEEIAKRIICRLFLQFAVTFALAIGVAHSAESPASGYDALIQQAKSQLDGSPEQAAAAGNAAIKLSKERWEGYALVGGALMNLKRYEAAADTLSEAIKRAPEAKQPALRDLRRQCLLAESGSPAVANTSSPASTTSQAEIVLWKSIENSANPADFRSYLDRYPQGAFAVLAERHLAEGNTKADYQAAFNLVKEGQYDRAIGAFQTFLAANPESSLADNAQYWLGEAFYLNKAYAEAQSAFQRVIDKYPQSRKLPDVLIKIGYCRYEMKQYESAREVLGQVVARYVDTPEGHLAQQRLDRMTAEKH
jgi:tol-pal system protein YbgF